MVCPEDSKEYCLFDSTLIPPGIKECRAIGREWEHMWAGRKSEHSSCMRGHDTWNGLHAWLGFVAEDNSRNQLWIAGSIPAQARFHLYTAETQAGA